jgi:hypothetical protein
MAVKDKHIIDLFLERDGLHSIVKLENDLVRDVWDIAWGYDDGYEFAHITTNISPGLADRPVDFFYSSEIVEIKDALSEEILFKK